MKPDSKHNIFKISLYLYITSALLVVAFIWNLFIIETITPVFILASMASVAIMSYLAHEIWKRKTSTWWEIIIFSVFSVFLSIKSIFTLLNIGLFSWFEGGLYAVIILIPKSILLLNVIFLMLKNNNKEAFVN